MIRGDCSRLVQRSYARAAAQQQQQQQQQQHGPPSVSPAQGPRSSNASLYPGASATGGISGSPKGLQQQQGLYAAPASA
mgnify:CR=1 FL=1